MLSSTVHPTANLSQAGSIERLLQSAAAYRHFSWRWWAMFWLLIASAVTLAALPFTGAVTGGWIVTSVIGAVLSIATAVSMGLYMTLDAVFRTHMSTNVALAAQLMPQIAAVAADVREQAIMIHSQAAAASMARESKPVVPAPPSK